MLDISLSYVKSEETKLKLRLENPHFRKKSTRKCMFKFISQIVYGNAFLLAITIFREAYKFMSSIAISANALWNTTKLISALQSSFTKFQKKFVRVDQFHESLYSRYTSLFE